MKLGIVIGSTRPGRVGLPITNWFVAQAKKKQGQFDLEILDLAEFNLPIFNEPDHPRLGKYQHEHTKKWSAAVAACDAFVFVTPEYNFFAPPALVNAVTYLSKEWAYKPLGFVSYGGISAGTRAVQTLKQLMTSVRVMPLPENVNVSMFSAYMKEGAFVGNEVHEKAAELMLNELHRWATALKPLRAA